MYIAHDKNAINSECPFFVIYRIHVNAMYIAFRLWGVGAAGELAPSYSAYAYPKNPPQINVAWIPAAEAAVD